MPLTHFDRYATITIQGGGVYGLNLLGQLAELVDEREIIPIALAGNSAGAIIATLYWAGLSPLAIKNKFKEACTTEPGQTHSRLMNLLGPFDVHGDGPYDFGKFLAMKSRFDGYLSTFDSPLFHDDGSEQRSWLRRLIWRVGRYCWNVGALVQILRASDDVSPHLRNNGIFRGDLFERTIDEWIRDSPLLKPYLAGSDASRLLPPPVGQEGGRLLTFGDLANLQRRESSKFPPLFLTATNLTLRRLELISSFGPDFAHWPIARAVRASAGFPVFFRPVSVEGRPVGCWYVDGGLISNFPSWIFGQKFRSNLAETDSDYQYLAAFPWLNIGLRVVDDPGPSIRRDKEDDLGAPVGPVLPHPLKPKMFIDSLVSLVTGRARNEIEDILSTFISRSRTIHQPISETSGPENLLAFHQVDAARVSAMYDSGRRAARREFSGVDYHLPGEDQRQQVVALLQTMAERSWAILRPVDAKESARDIFRANVYLPQRDKLRPWCTWNMDGAPDVDLVFDLGCGLTGFCHARRRPFLGNLKTIADLYDQGDLDAIRFFGLEEAKQETITRSGRTWLASFPIFDPGDIGLHEAPVEPARAERSYHCEVSSPIEAGGVFGVMNLDGAFDLNALGLHDEPAYTLTDHRIASIIALLQSTAFEVGQILSASYPNSANVEVEDGYRREVGPSN